MTKQGEVVGHAEIVGGGQTVLHSHAGGGDLPGLHYGIIKGSTLNRYYPAGANNTVALGTAGVGAAANALRVFPFIPPMGITAERLACWVSTLLAGNNIKLGIWANGTNLYPSTLLASIELNTGTAGLREGTISVAMTAGNLYWMGYVLNTITTLAFRKLAVSAYASIMGLSNASTPVQGIGWTRAHTYANTLPNPYTAGGTVLAVVADLIIAIRAA